MTAEDGDHLDPEFSAQLSALLDGELSAAETSEVRDRLSRSPEATAELAALTEIRARLRELPPVDPPSGFFERLARDEQRRAFHRHLLATAAAVVVALVAVTASVVTAPPAQAMVPPVQDYAVRHEAVTAPAGAAPVGSSAPGPPAVAAVPLGDTAYQPIDDLSMRAGEPSVMAQLAPGLDRAAAWIGPGGVVQVEYRYGPTMVSVFSEPGMADWDRMPSGGSRGEVGYESAWWARLGTSGTTEVLVIQKGDTVVTVVASIPADELMAIAAHLPEPPSPTFADHFQRAAEDCARRFGFGG